MPNWQPNWNNVRWSWHAADETAAALRRMADLLDQTSHDRERVAREAQATWRGRYREQFDERLTEMISRAHDLAEECRRAASQIAWASQRAAEEQQRREWERERWRREKEAEERERRHREEEERRKERRQA